MSFPRYPNYKGSGVDWFRDVPAHWEVTKVRWLFEIRKRIAGELGFDVFSITQQGFRTKDVESHAGQVSLDYSKYQFVEVGDFAMNHMDLITGGVDIARSRGVTSPDYRVFSIRDRLNVHDRYFLYLFQTCLRERIFFAYGQGSSQLGRWRFPTDNFKDFRFPVPPPVEQEGIAEFLVNEVAKIDALVAEQRLLIDLLREKRQAVISSAVTKGLNPDAPMKPSGIEWLGNVPAHWKVVALKRIADVNTGVAKGKLYGSQKTITVPYLRVANVQDGYLDLERVATIEIAADELDRYRLRNGDVLMNEGGDFDKLGRGCVWEGQVEPCITQNHVFAVRPRHVSPDWLNAVTSSDFAQFYFMTRSKQSTNLASISSTNLMELPVILPPRDEQRAILSSIGDQTARFDTLTAETQRAIDLLQERRTALISAAVTGQIDLRGDVASASIEKPYSSGFARQLLAAEILSQCHQHPSTGRVKLQKLIHLCEHVAEIEEIGASYMREAAGPFDSKVMFGLAKGLAAQKWFLEVKDEGRTFYRALEKAGAHAKYLARWQSQIPRIHRVLQLLGTASTQQCEIVSTLYAAWNDLLIEGRSPSDAEVIHDASSPDTWHESKADIPSDKWPLALNWMREHDLVPRGFGRHTNRPVSEAAHE